MGRWDGGGFQYHRVAWVRELPKGRDFMDKGHAVITGMAIGPVTEIPA
jgi:hypothetical protein